MKYLLISAILMTGLVARAQEQPRVISTNGEAVIFVVPDEVIINLGVETYATELDDSKKQNDEHARKLVEAIQSMGIEEKHIGTSQMEVAIDYKDNSRADRGVEGYTVRRNYSVKLKDVQRLENFIDTTLKSGANRLTGVDFQTTELRKHRDEARRMAIRAAKEKAQLLAGELDSKVGKPRTINEGGGYYAPRGRYNASQNAFQDTGGGGEGEGTLPLGQIEIRANISVTFDLE